MILTYEEIILKNIIYVQNHRDYFLALDSDNNIYHWGNTSSCYRLTGIELFDEYYINKPKLLCQI